MIPKERIEELSVKAAEVASEIANDAIRDTSLEKLKYANQQLIVVKNISKMLVQIMEYHMLNGDYEEI